MKKLNPSVKLFIAGACFTLLPPVIIKTLGGHATPVLFLVLAAPVLFLLGGLKSLYEKDADYTVSPMISRALNWGGVLVFLSFIIVGIVSRH